MFGLPSCSKLFLLLIFLFTSQTAFAENTVILHAGTLLDIPGEAPKSEQTLVVINDKVSKIYDGYLTARQLDLNTTDTSIVDLKNSFVLPGLIDAHVHLMFRYGGAFRDPSITGEDQLITGIVNAKATLEAGFTTVADLDAGAYSWPVFVLRNAIRAGEIAGPRILAAGSSISRTGGHGDRRDAPDHILEKLGSSGLCDGEAECRRAVRRQFRQGSDLIKLHATGGGNEKTGGKHHQPSFMEDEFRGIVETAHSLELKVTAHAHATAGINAALKAGVDSIEHGSFLDKESIRLFRKSGAYLLPTLDVQDMISDLIHKVPAHAAPRLKLYLEEQPANVMKAWKAGVNLALGSDAGVIPHGSNAREIEWFVKIGISESEALKIATVNTAKHLGLADQIGSLKPEMNADVIAFRGNPLEDISVVRDVMFVMKAGQVINLKEE
ncbi:MAG: amidohydrolase family protein [Gammaproteobacteria bacterium]|nr:amidohydrolase family protein [Gammaproteobacteria bacterium]